MGRPLPDALAAALDARFVREALVEIVRTSLCPDARVRRVTGRILKRATIRYEIELAGAPLSSWSVIGKVHPSRAAGESACAAQRWLWEEGFPDRPPSEISIPRIFGFFPELELLLMEEAGGRSLQRLLNKRMAGAEDVRHFAEALVKLHRFPADGVPPFTVDRYLEEKCRGLTEQLARDFPDLATPIARIVEDARKIEAELLPTYTLAHGDYHPGQVHVGSDRHWLLDLDHLWRRDPAYDLAMAVVKLRGLVTRRGADGPYRELLEAFLESYLASMDDEIAQRVPINAALIFLKRACKRFHYRDEPDWPAAIHHQISRAEECLAVHESRRQGRGLSAALENCLRCPGATGDREAQLLGRAEARARAG